MFLVKQQQEVQDHEVVVGDVLVSVEGSDCQDRVVRVWDPTGGQQQMVADWDPTFGQHRVVAV